ncbi:MAG: SLC13 family permease [Nitrospirales bacterium]|nr:sodium-coupled transporter [Nitrospira sp.]MDR4460523.1 SLC13 family permease [Nitrospirales bacterium]MDR4484907.1 SLC13 family permease [Nitrospirales bacterium]
MNSDHLFFLGLLGILLVFFIWERWRYDLVALTALLLSTVLGFVPSEEAFLGFGHPAVVTVAAVLIISRGLSNAGGVEILTRFVRGVTSSSPSLHVAVLSSLGGLISTFMNNVGALALLMPVAIQSSVEVKRSPAIVLMPLAFGTILGGMVTLIGTPPNIIVAHFRAEVAGKPFGMFDFTPVGGVVAFVGILFVALVGWRLLPVARRSQNAPQDLFSIQEYLTEVEVPENSKAIGKSLSELEMATEDSDALIIGLVRGDQSIRGAAWREHIQVGDVLILEAGPQGINKFVSTLGLKLTGTQPKEEVQDSEPKPPAGKNEDMLLEAVVPPDRSWLVGRLAGSLKLRSRFGINLLGASRQGTPYRGRLREFRFKAGDVLLLQGEKERVLEVIGLLGCLPLAERGLQLGKPGQASLAIGLFAVALGSAISGLASLPIALICAALGMVLLNIVSPRDVYLTVDWPVLVLLGAMIPIGRALEQSGTTTVLAGYLVTVTEGFPPIMLLALIMVLTMTLSDVMNNAATAVVMAPLSVAVSQYLGVDADPFLMAVAIGASCAFLTPIGHQNNLLVMGPGGYRFGDYWRIGLPLELLILMVSLPLLVYMWPLTGQG